MLFIFSIPFTVGLHKHTDTFCAVTVRLTIQPPEAMTTWNTPKMMHQSSEETQPEEQIKPSSKKKQSEFTLIIKPA